MSSSPAPATPWGAPFSPAGVVPDNGIRAGSGLSMTSERSMLEMEVQGQARVDKMEANRVRDKEELKSLIHSLYGEPPQPTPQPSPSTEAMLITCSTNDTRDRTLLSTPPSISFSQVQTLAGWSNTAPPTNCSTSGPRVGSLLPTPLSIPLMNRAYDGSFNPSYSRPKLDLPNFTGKEAHRWLHRAEQFMDFYNISTDVRVRMAALYLEEGPLEWYQGNVRAKGKSLSWVEFEKGLVSMYDISKAHKVFDGIPQPLPLLIRQLCDKIPQSLSRDPVTDVNAITTTTAPPTPTPSAGAVTPSIAAFSTSTATTTSSTLFDSTAPVPSQSTTLAITTTTSDASPPTTTTPPIISFQPSTSDAFMPSVPLFGSAPLRSSTTAEASMLALTASTTMTSTIHTNASSLNTNDQKAFDEMHEKDVVGFTALRACARLHSRPLAIAIHFPILMLGNRPNAYRQTTLHNLYSNHDNIETARQVFDGMHEPPRLGSSLNCSSNLGNISTSYKDLGLYRELGLVYKVPRLVGAQDATTNPLYLYNMSGWKGFEPVTASQPSACAIQIDDSVYALMATNGIVRYDSLVTEKTLLAMPENGVGLFSDVSFAYIATQAPVAGAVGMYLGLIGKKISSPADALFVGLGTHYVPSGSWASVKDELLSLNFTDDPREDILGLLAQYKKETESEAQMKMTLPHIVSCFDANKSVPKIMEELKKHQQSVVAGMTEWASEALLVLGKGTPLPLGLTDNHFSDVASTHGRNEHQLSKLHGVMKAECAKRALSNQHQVRAEIELLYDGLDFSEPLKFYNFKRGFASSVKQALKLSIVTFFCSTVLIVFLVDQFKRESTVQQLLAQLVYFYIGTPAISICQELSHHLSQDAHTRMCSLAPPQGSAVAGTNSTEELLEAREQGTPRSATLKDLIGLLKASILMWFVPIQQYIAKILSMECVVQVRFNDIASQLVYHAMNIGPFLFPLFTNLFEALKFTESWKYRIVIKCLRMVLKVTNICEAVAKFCSDSFTSIIVEMCHNPMSLVFSNYLLEATTSFIRISWSDLSLTRMFEEEGASEIQFEEPTLVLDLISNKLEAVTKTYVALKSSFSGLKVLVWRYYADVHVEAYKTHTSLSSISGFVFDRVRGAKTITFIKNVQPRGLG